MSIISERVARNLDALDAGRPLVELIDTIIREYPDPYTLANEHAQRILLKHTGKNIDPRFVWWHQFNGASSSPRTVTGFQHSGPPQKSVQLTQLVIKRFDLPFQEAPDELAVYGGFYWQGPRAGFFDERNEVHMLGSQFQADLWRIDFAEDYRNELARFWSAHGQDFRVLAKVSLLGQCHTAVKARRISQLDAGRLRAMACEALPGDLLPTLAQLKVDSTGNPFRIARYALGESDHGCLYSLATEDGRVVVFRPWISESFVSFDSALAMARWLRSQLQHEATFASFFSAALGDARSEARAHTVRTHLRSIADSKTDEAALALLRYLERPVNGDFFSYVARQAHEEMRDYATAMLSNTDLRKAMWRGYLGAFLKVFGGFVPLGWPMGLLLLGAGIAKTGLDVDAALHARDDYERKNALRDAMLDSLFAALNMADLGFQSGFASLGYGAQPHELNVSVGQWRVVESASLPVEGIESNDLIAGELVQAGRLRNVRVEDDGSCWIVLNGLSYRVRYSPELSTWLVVPADNPYAFSPLYPVRLNDAGEWELLAAMQLHGGAPTAIEGVPSTTSRFWDTYTSIDTAQSKLLSATALHRQKALLKPSSITELQPGRTPDVDARGLDCVLVNGTPSYSYRHGRDYFNSLIEYYTSDESKVNDVFRSGTYRYGDEDEYLGELTTELAGLPKSNKVNLYRGGHHSRNTGGERYRSGQLKVGDVLVSTDFTSFTENPYMVSEFASKASTEAPGMMPGTFDDSSVVFELPAGQYRNGTPISPFSLYWGEGETLFLPGSYFRIDRLEQVYGDHYHFIHVLLSDVAKPASGPVYDLRTGLLFDPEVYRRRIKTPALLERFFPGAAS